LRIVCCGLIGLLVSWLFLPAQAQQFAFALCQQTRFVVYVVHRLVFAHQRGGRRTWTGSGERGGLGILDGTHLSASGFVESGERKAVFAFTAGEKWTAEGGGGYRERGGKAVLREKVEDSRGWKLG
jgi:N-acetylmuramic acid 6-phosphate (MurNAc-6-P) etherase